MTQMHQESVEGSPPLPLSASAAEGESSGPALERQHRQREQQMRSHVHYLGFRSTDDGREYTVRVTGKTSRLFVMVIPHQHFAGGRARFQDGPDLCCTKLTRMLMDETGDDEPDGRCVLTVEELLEYRTRRTAPPPGRRRERRNHDDDAGAEPAGQATPPPMQDDELRRPPSGGVERRMTR